MATNNERLTGTYFYPTLSYDSSDKKPFDARMLVPSYAALTNKANWETTHDGEYYTLAYNGMIVAVADKEDEENSGIYMLFDKSDNKQPDVTDSKNWHKVNKTPSWDDLQDKPFYEETYSGEMVLTYDGTSEGKTVIELPDDQGSLVKVSEWTTTPEYLIGANAVVGDEALVLQEEDIIDFRSEGYPLFIITEFCFMALEPVVFQGVVFPEPGTYIADFGVEASFTYTGISTRIQQIPKKYLPPMAPASGDTGSSAVGNVHIIDIGDQDFNIGDLNLDAYNEGDVLLIIQNQSVG